jgi:cation transport ATPase
MFSGSRSGSSGGLTRTTLQLYGAMSIPSVAQVRDALQRVPGVLLAEVNPQSARAVVAHDVGVPAASLLAAAARAGVRAAILAGVRAPAAGVDSIPELRQARIRRRATVALAVFLTLILIDISNASIATMQWAMPIVFSLLLLFFVVEAVVDRRP